MSGLDLIEYRLRANSRGSMAVAPVLVIIGIWAPLPDFVGLALIVFVLILILRAVWHAFRPAPPTGTPC